MQRINGKIVYSASDLVGFLSCGHLTNLERASMVGLVKKPTRLDPELDILEKRGLQHERTFLEELRSKGLAAAEIAPNRSLESTIDQLLDATQQTKKAMRLGEAVIYQATFFDGRRRGHADFLIRVEEPSNLGVWSYEVWDVKLARRPKGSAVLQLCFYIDLLSDLQGRPPEQMYLALGGSAALKVGFRTSEYMAYYRMVVREFEALIGGSEPAYPPATRPDPVEHCDVCRWSEMCVKDRRRSDDLSLVAGITAKQRRLFRDRGISSRTALGSIELPFKPPLIGVNNSSIERVHEQARIQVQGDQADGLLYEILDPSRTKDGELEQNRGLLSLPEPSAGDLFFDIEGDPFAMADGVDYLFGVLEPGILDNEGAATFHKFWSIDEHGEVTAQAEREAFERLIDFVIGRLDEDPNLHVYHYAPYEPTTMRRLMGRYGTREDEVDRLLRGNVFVDLFRAVRQGIRASVESYSIKRLEPLYGFERSVDLRDAGSSIVAFETWLELGSEIDDGPDILKNIEHYNKDDCVSNLMLRDWLEGRRQSLADELGEALPRPQAQSGEAEEELAENLTKVATLAEELTRGVPEDAEVRTPEQQARWLLAQLLYWHRREEKSSWWRYFYLMHDLTDDDRISEPDAMGNLIACGAVRKEKRSIVYQFKFPPQDHKIEVGSSPHDPATGKSAGKVVSVNDETGLIELSRGESREPPEPTSLVPLDIVGTNELRDSLYRIATSLVEHGIDHAEQYRVALALLQRQSPRVGQVQNKSLIEPGESVGDASRRLALSLEQSYLAIQGPPGSGKTTIGAEMIVDLVLSGKRVGVTANSHKVIGQLLAKVADASERRQCEIKIGQRIGTDGVATYDKARALKSSTDVHQALTEGEINVVGGTAWLWSREEMSETIDVLFVDEAGQFSLANVIAVSGATHNLVLLGDPQQLDQPLTGVHPPGADLSALGHVLGDQQTMPSELGLFISDTWRLHPDICNFTSEVFYEGRLSPHEGRGRQRISGSGWLSGSGLRLLTIEHEGHDSASPEEAKEIALHIQELLTSGETWTDEEGREHKLTIADVLVITPYNAQVKEIAEVIQNARVGTVDKFQGQEAPISIYSMATSSADDAPRGMEFLYSLHRLNVATSRARCIAAVVASPRLFLVRCKTPRQMQLANGLARLVELAQ